MRLRVAQLGAGRKGAGEVFRPRVGPAALKMTQISIWMSGLTLLSPLGARVFDGSGQWKGCRAGLDVTSRK